MQSNLADKLHIQDNRKGSNSQNNQKARRNSKASQEANKLWRKVINNQYIDRDHTQNRESMEEKEVHAPTCNGC